MSRLTKISIMLAAFFALDKVVAILRQVIIARQFGLSAELDAYNVANNVPDLLFALISGGALAMAFIPVLTEQLTLGGRKTAWNLFSRIANLAFIVTALLAVLVALLANQLVGAELGIAPGFQGEQRMLVVNLMRINLIATLIFSISGLVMAGLQANQHFLLPAIAPLLYNLGQIFGAVFLAPEKGYSLGGITLPTLGLGVYGLVYGVILGAVLHLCIQIPALIKYQFHWIPSLGLKDAAVQQVLRLMGPRLLTIFLVQVIFLVRDNLASRLAQGSVTALTYGWMIQQVPETLIGTAIATALLPTLSELVARNEAEALKNIIERAVRVLIAITLPVAVVVGLGLRPFIQVVFGFDAQGTDLMLWVTRGYLLGLAGHSVLEIAARSFYAQQNAWIPLIGAVINTFIYITVGSQLFRPLGAAGISLTDSLAFTTQAIFVLLMLNRRLISKIQIGNTLVRALAAALLAGVVMTLVGNLVPEQSRLMTLIAGVGVILLGSALSLPLIWREIRILFRL